MSSISLLKGKGRICFTNAPVFLYFYICANLFQKNSVLIDVSKEKKHNSHLAQIIKNYHIYVFIYTDIFITTLQQM